MTSVKLETIFEQFLKERTYLQGSRPKTLTFYRSSFRAYQRFSGSATLPTKADLNAFVTGMREQGRKTVTCNTYIRGMNSFLSWLHENGHLSEHLKIKQLKAEWKVMAYLIWVAARRLVGKRAPFAVKSSGISIHITVRLKNFARPFVPHTSLHVPHRERVWVELISRT